MRLDKYLFEKGYFSSRNKSSDAINKGLVKVNGSIAKNSTKINEGDNIEIIDDGISFVSQGGYKLYKALHDFNFIVKDKIFADIGASTGGFTDCLIKNDAKKVYAVDVGEGLLDESLINNDKVVVMDKTNAKLLKNTCFDEALDGVVVDCSFISLTHLFLPLSNLLTNGCTLIALIKPQFEMKERVKFKNGIIKSKDIHYSVCNEIVLEAEKFELFAQEITVAPIKDKKNKEFLVRFVKNGEKFDLDEKIRSVVYE